jgi:hypothetical protein
MRTEMDAQHKLFEDLMKQNSDLIAAITKSIANANTGGSTVLAPEPM